MIFVNIRRYVRRKVYFCKNLGVNYETVKRYIYILLGILLAASACMHRKPAPQKPADTVDASIQSLILWTDEQLEAEETDKEVCEELFDDFLYNYIHDTVLQRNRVIFPLQEIMVDDSLCQIYEEDWNRDYYFIPADYTIALYNSEAEMSINEDTALWRASVEKIDLVQRTIKAYDFRRMGKLWSLVAIRHMNFVDSDLKDFLQFYARFAGDNAFRGNSLARSIHISVMNPDDESQNIDGFINREQWPTIDTEMPQGTVMNIRYGQQYLHSQRILMEKTSMGDGMSEIFTFAKGSRGWGLVGYEN